MTRTKQLTWAVLFIALATGCASKPSPEEVCSAAWIKPRTDSAMREFQATTSDAWESLRNNTEGTGQDGLLDLVEKARVLLNLTRLVNEFRGSQALEDLRTLERTCNRPDLVRNAVVSTLQDYNVPQPYIDLLNDLEGFAELLQQGSTI